MGRDRCRRDIPVESQRMCPHGRSVRKKRGRDMDGERERGCKSTQGRRADCERSSATAFPIYHLLYVPWYHGRALQTPDNVYPGMRKGAPSTLRHATLHKRHSRTSDTNGMSTNAPASLLRALPPSHSEVFRTTGSALTRTAGGCVGRSRLHPLVTPGARRLGGNWRNKRTGRDIHEWASTPLLCSSILSRDACRRLGRRCSFPVYPTTLLQPKPTTPLLRPALPGTDTRLRRRP
ncbi:hypothetical protein B0H13DRAFT_225167 [Mycena leptocephala]|nr:hypothetical protein B0H13DRAFT_225167 [Mycena leptocephala]